MGETSDSRLVKTVLIGTHRAHMESQKDPQWRQQSIEGYRHKVSQRFQQLAQQSAVVFPGEDMNVKELIIISNCSIVKYILGQK